MAVDVITYVSVRFCQNNLADEGKQSFFLQKEEGTEGRLFFPG